MNLPGTTIHLLKACRTIEGGTPFDIFQAAFPKDIPTKENLDATRRLLIQAEKQGVIMRTGTGRSIAFHMTLQGKARLTKELKCRANKRRKSIQGS